MLYLSILLHTPSVPLLWELSPCFCMVMEAGLLGSNMVLEGHPLAVSACQQSGLSAPRDASPAGEPKNGLGSHIIGTLGGPSVPILTGMSFLCGCGGLGRFFLCTSDLFLQYHSLPAVVVVLEEGLIPCPAPLCVTAMVLECPFPDPAFL